MGRMMREYFLQLLANFEFLPYLKHDQSIPDSDVTPEYCAKHNWIIGSPATVAEKIEKIHNDVGGFGNLLVFGFDYVEHPEVWHRSLELLAKEVLPKVKHLSAA
jgi:alkanesulfonate monooxygenase SsuD/methylene tetrahydromethanopterin reductase-like flavin-dependent oxidoreductase (luciferase family)